MAPTGVDLLAISDSGISDSDNLTNLDNSTIARALQFEVSGTVDGATVTLYADGWPIGTAAATGETTNVITSGTRDLNDGSHTITARQTELGQSPSRDSPARVITIDAVAALPSREIAKLLAADGVAADYFGNSVSVSGDVAIVAAYTDDDKGSNSGSVYLFEDSGSGWTQVAKVAASDGAAGDSFGYSVSISGSTAIVGAPNDDDKSVSSGSVYIFEDMGSGWTQIAKLTAADGEACEGFGSSVSISGSVAVVGTPSDNNMGVRSGSAYVFADTGSGWTQMAKLTPNDGEGGDSFGSSVSISDLVAIVGAPRDDDNGAYSGSAYVFADTGSGWTQMAKLTASDGEGGDGFGSSVSISDLVAIVGAPCDNDKGYYSGSAYLFADTGAAWTQVRKLTAPDGEERDGFGCDVSISGSTAVVGSTGNDSVDSRYGSAYVFCDVGSGWSQLTKFTVTDSSARKEFGSSVSISGSTAIAGACRDDDNGIVSGSAYLFNTVPLVSVDTGAEVDDQTTSDTTPVVALTFTEPICGQDADVTVRDPNGATITPDSVAGWGTSALAVTFNTSLTVDGQYTVTLHGTITDAAGNAINKGDDEIVVFTLDTVAPAAPPAPDLQAPSDCGASDSDNLTNDNTPTFEAAGMPYFRLYRDGIQISGNYESGSYTTAIQPDGTHQYTVTAVDAAGNESAPSVPLSVTIATETPSVPGALDLQAASDAGVSDADNVTADNTPTFDVNCERYFRVYRGMTRISGDFETGSSFTSPIQPSGTHDYTVTAVDAAGNESAKSLPLRVTIDAISPFHVIRQHAKFVAAEDDMFEYLGGSVSMSGSTAIAGALFDGDKGACSGSAYIFEDMGSSWTQIAKLTADDGMADDCFGSSVSISGSKALVGAYGAGGGRGAAYVFADTGSGWTQIAKLTADDGEGGDLFGRSVSISGSVAVVGAYHDGDKGLCSGSAYVFADTGSGWTQVAKLTAADGAEEDCFGVCVSISGSTAIIGAFYDDNKAVDAGSAYIFADSGSGWTQIAKLTAADGATQDCFGRSVAISGATAIVGRGRGDGRSSGGAYVFADTGSGWTQVAQLADDTAQRSFGSSVSISGSMALVGAGGDYQTTSAHVFTDTGLGWTQIAKLTATGGTAYDRFGSSVSISGLAALVGAPGDNRDSGAAYLFNAAPLVSDDTGARADDQISSDTTPVVTSTFTEPVYGHDGDVTVLDPNGNPVALGPITGWGASTIDIAFSTPLTVDGQYTVTLSGTITDAAGNHINGGVDQTTVFTLDTIVPATPMPPDLQAASDLGVCDSDDLTNDNTLTFDATGAPYFRLYCDGIQISGDYECGSYTTTIQPDGMHQYTVTAVDEAGNESAPSVPLSVTIDTEAPPAPAALDLQAASDTGVSDTDNITRDVTPTFDLYAAPWFRVYQDSILTSGEYEVGVSYTLPIQPYGTCEYSLTAVDAAGNESVKSPTLTVTIDTAAPSQSNQLARLLASDGAAGDFFGSDVAISGSIAIVGAPYDDDQGDSSGSAYIFEDTGSGWSQVAKLTPADGAAGYYFGCSVSISGSNAVVGAYSAGGGRGAAYVFADMGSAWTQVAKLRPSDGKGYRFGDSVSIDGSTVIIGASDDNEKGSSAGAAYVFADAGSGWTQIAKLTADDGEAHEHFGTSVSISGSVAIVGADGDNHDGGGVGSAYIFADAGSGWTQIAKLTADNTAGAWSFGENVSISGSRAVVAALGNRGVPNAAYLFEDTGSGWTQIAMLTADDRSRYDTRGYSVSLSGSAAVIGTQGYSTSLYSTNSAYVFQDTDSGWSRIAKPRVTDGPADNCFGSSVSISNSTVVVGAVGDDDRGNAAGAAYLFSLTPNISDDTGASANDAITSDTTPTLMVTLTESVFGQDEDVIVLDPHGNRITPDAIAGWGTNALAINFDTPLTVDGPYTVTLGYPITDVAGNAVNENLVFTLDTAGPAVEGVFVRSADWTDAFLDSLDFQGLGYPGVARLGYRLPTGADQFDALRWANIDTITAVFSEDVAVQQADLTLAGVNVPSYAVAGFRYDPATCVATWTLATPINTDRLAITLDDTIEDLAGNRLDGEWQNGASQFPSGNGAAGGGFRFAVNVLPGDANHDGAVTAADAAILAANWGNHGASLAPADFTGDGTVNAADAAVLATHWGTSLPPWFPGDADYSGIVDQADAAMIAAHWGMSGMTWTDGDFNRDGRVNAADAAILAANWGAAFTLPGQQGPREPASPVKQGSAVFVGPLPAGKPATRRMIAALDDSSDDDVAGQLVESTLEPTICASSLRPRAEAADAAIADESLVEQIGPQLQRTAARCFVGSSGVSSRTVIRRQSPSTRTRCS